MLEVRDVHAGYDKKQVLFGVSLSLQSGELVAVIGPNGAGKSTLLRVICGLIPAWRGQICFDGSMITGSTPTANVARGITFAPQGGRVFADLTVEENLQIGGFALRKRKLHKRIDRVLEVFPPLRGRLNQDAGSLSGGEQQMLAIARSLITEPRLLMLDEPSLGLAPNLVRGLLERVSHVNRETGAAVLIVEQKVREVLDICSRVYSIRLGKVAFEGPAEGLRENKAKLQQLFL